MALSSAKGQNSKKLTEKFLQLRSEALKRGLDAEQLREAMAAASSQTEKKKLSLWSANPAYRMHVLVALIAVASGVFMTCRFLSGILAETECLVESNLFTDEIFRPLVDCEMCRDVYSVPEERNLSTDDFYQKYSFTGRPVLIKDGTSNWTAMSQFSFHFFRHLYLSTRGSLQTIEDDCQFFAYDTEFHTLADALSMPDERATFQPGQPSWYFGWSNCHEGVRKKLRQYYQRPYFLPLDSESVPEDWIFMGGPGPGAFVHLDYVMRPSWQAQISGKKTWQLIPTPECENVCHSFNVTVHKGDIIVVDTNIWYHSTFVHPGEVSITIGSEYD